MADKYFGLIWSITALVLGGMGAFGPPSLIRGYSYVKDKPEELNRIVGIYKSFGLFFFIVGHLGLVATAIFSISDQDYIKLGLVVLTAAFEVLVLIRLNVFKSQQRKRYLRQILLSIFVWFLINAILYYLVGPVDWIIFIQIPIIAIVLLLRLYNKLC